MPSPPDPLVARGQLGRYGVPSAFLAQFELRPFQVLISVGGALGAMAFQWRFVGDDSSAWSPSIYSTAGSTWTKTIDDVFADLTFATFTYVASTIYTVDTKGVVTGGSELTASVYDLVANACSSVTTEAFMRMADSIRQPLTAWGDDTRQRAADWVYAILKRSKGATPSGAGTGDDNIFIAEHKAIEYFDLIGQKGKPASMTDTSTSADGPMMIYPVSDDPRCW